MGARRTGWVVLGCLAAAAPVGALAEDGGYDAGAGITGPLVWNVGGTLAVPLSDSADRVNVGGGFTIGATYVHKPTSLLGVQLEYGLNWASLDTGTLASNGVVGDGLMHYLDLNAMLLPFHHGRVGLYLVGGGGVYYRKADVTRVEGTAVAPYCDPWLYFCSVTPVTAATVIGSRHSWDLGLDAGVGLTMAVVPPIRLYLEVRYHYIFGPSFTTPSGDRRSADGQYLPITLGVRL